MRRLMSSSGAHAVAAMLWLAVFCASTVAIAADEPVWKPIREEDGIRVYTQAVPDSDFREFRGESVIAAEVNQIMALMIDIPACPDWMHRCTESVLLEQIDMTERYTYTRNSYPWPASDRVFIIHSRVTQDPDTRVVTIRLTDIDEPKLSEAARRRLPESGRPVRVDSAKGTWTLIPIDEGSTRAIYEMHVEIGGRVPASLANSIIEQTPFETLLRLREVVQREKYRCFRPF